MTQENMPTLSACQNQLSSTSLESLKRSGLLDGMTCAPKLCLCDHKLTGTGAVFYQSLGWLHCNECKGWQEITKPLI